MTDVNMFWLSRQANGSYMLTLKKPHYVRIDGSKHFDFYVRAGDRIGLRNMCPGGTHAMFGFELKIGESIKVWLYGGRGDP
jgi:hypothetical protein